MIDKQLWMMRRRPPIDGSMPRACFPVSETTDKADSYSIVTMMRNRDGMEFKGKPRWLDCTQCACPRPR